MRILITNDDGIDSPVLRQLADKLSPDHEVIISAPANDQSGMAQAFTFNRPLRCEKLEIKPFEKYKVHGSPCDCIKLAICRLLQGKTPDLIISGINFGENSGICALYSGTVAAAREGALWEIPSIAVSVWKESEARLVHAINWLSDWLKKPGVLDLPKGFFWNINFPPCEPEEISGEEVTEMSSVMFHDNYSTRDTENEEYFWLEGAKPVDLFKPGTDDWALKHGRIALTPLGVNQGVNSGLLEQLRKKWPRVER